MQLISALIFYGMFAALLVLIGLSLRESVNRRHRFDAAILEAARLSAESARAAAEAAKAVAAYLEKREHA